MLLWAFLPVLAIYQSSILFKIPFLGAMGLWILTGLMQMSIKSRRKCLRLIIPYMLLMYLYVFIGYGDLSIPTSFDYALLFGFVVNGIYYIEQPDLKFNKWCVRFSLLLLIVTAITTLAVLMVDGTAARSLTSSSSDDSVVMMYKSMNVGSFGFIYGLVVIIPMVFSYSLAQKNFFLKLVIWAITILFVVVVLMSNFTTALILLFIDFVLIIIAGSKLKSISSFWGILIVLAIIVPFLLTSFLSFMIQMSDSIYAQGKLEGILDVIHNQGSYDDTTSRGRLFLTSFHSFLESPIWGVGAWYSQADSRIVGQHAQFIDDLARYGLLGFIPLISFLIFGLKKIYYAFKEKFFFNRKVLGPILIYFILGFLDPIYIPGLLASIFILVPMLDRFTYENKNTIYR